MRHTRTRKRFQWSPLFPPAENAVQQLPVLASGYILAVCSPNHIQCNYPGSHFSSTFFSSEHPAAVPPCLILLPQRLKLIPLDILFSYFSALDIVVMEVAHV